jgi:hypothetical protein
VLRGVRERPAAQESVITRWDVASQRVLRRPYLDPQLGSHEHNYWDQATVLVQAGLLHSSGLPVVGSEQAEALLDQGRPKNELFASNA